MNLSNTIAAAMCCIGVAPVLLAAQHPHFTAETKQYVVVDTPVVVLRHVRIIDGTGAAPREDQTIVLSHGLISAVGNAATTPVPAGAQILDLAGRTVMPGLVMLHEHMFYPTGGVSIYNENAFSFPKLYFASGATTIRTAGSMEPYTDLNVKAMIDSGAIVGPKMDVTGPYIEGPGLNLYQVHPLSSPADATDMVRYWAEHGATSFKLYMDVTRAELGAAVAEAHRRNLKITGHLCSVTFREAAALGIDNLEHGIVVSSDFVKDKQPDVCPKGGAVLNSIAAIDIAGDSVSALIRDLVSKHVAMTSTLGVFETFAAHRPPIIPGALDAMTPEARIQYLQGRSRIGDDTSALWATLLHKEMQFERAYAAAGGLLLSGSDPTGYGGVVPGYSNQREIELLVEAGFSVPEAIKISSLNGAQYLGRADRIGSIAAGKVADLLVVHGDPASRVRDIENAEMVFKDGIGYDSERLFHAARGVVGLH